MKQLNEHKLDGPIALVDLTDLAASEVLLRNADLAVLGRAVFDLGGADICFSRVASSPDEYDAPAVWLWLEWSGATFLAGISSAWAEVVTQNLADQSVTQLGEAGLDLLGHLRLAPLLPSGLNLREVALTQKALQGEFGKLSCLGVWRGCHLATEESSGHELQLWSSENFALKSLLLCCAQMAQRYVPSPLAHMPITLPLTAANWPVPASILTELSLGDVLILN